MGADKTRTKARHPRDDDQVGHTNRSLKLLPIAFRDKTLFGHFTQLSKSNSKEFWHRTDGTVTMGSLSIVHYPKPLTTICVPLLSDTLRLAHQSSAFLFSSCLKLSTLNCMKNHSAQETKKIQYSEVRYILRFLHSPPTHKENSKWLPP
ncbi:hypothetical protein EG68_01468 [Paragonimus skrjabini miyazakii]|uniref:Uncharacterized protein n=1 Tax=Paragonimus skrjabini miyazakii TaxID=59628 RepID=A0A8S9Z761_9TREM|nr:hypothetical protein EG68_01468 [Paragonimus skrjabini miyazakii]